MVRSGSKGKWGGAAWACTLHTGHRVYPCTRASACSACVRACGVGGRAVVPWDRAAGRVHSSVVRRLRRGGGSREGRAKRKPHRTTTAAPHGKLAPEACEAMCVYVCGVCASKWCDWVLMRRCGQDTKASLLTHKHKSEASFRPIIVHLHFHLHHHFPSTSTGSSSSSSTRIPCLASCTQRLRVCFSNKAESANLPASHAPRLLPCLLLHSF